MSLGKLASELQHLARINKMSIKSIKDRVSTVSYEHVRKVVNGEAFPSPAVLNEIAQAFGADYERLAKLLVEDKVYEKHPTMPWTLSNTDPSLKPLEAIWPRLQPQQRDDIVLYVKALVERNNA